MRLESHLHPELYAQEAHKGRAARRTRAGAARAPRTAALQASAPSRLKDFHL